MYRIERVDGDGRTLDLEKQGGFGSHCKTRQLIFRVMAPIHCPYFRSAASSGVGVLLKIFLWKKIVIAA
jgi:hypothetical protein